MNIRALTGFLDPGWPLEPRRIGAVAACMKACRDALQSGGYNVQTLRYATPPPAEMVRPVRAVDRPELARQLEAEAFVHGLDYACLGPALPDDADGLAAMPDILGRLRQRFHLGALRRPGERRHPLGGARPARRPSCTTSTLPPGRLRQLALRRPGQCASGVALLSLRRTTAAARRRWPSPPKPPNWRSMRCARCLHRRLRAADWSA